MNHYDRGYSGQANTSQTQRELNDYNRGRTEREQIDRYNQQMAEFHRNGQKPAPVQITQGEALSFVSALAAAAAFWYVWSYFNNWLLGLIAGAVVWRFAESRLGQVLVKFLLVLVGLGLMWFFSELSKTFR